MNNEDAFLQPIPVAQASEDVRSRFIVRTYNHLFGAIALFTLIEIVLFKSGVAERIASALMGNWLLVLGGFMLVGWFSSRAAATSKSLGSQYLALVAFVAAEAIIFVPLLFVANAYSQQTDGSNVIASAAGTTILGCAGLTVVAFVTRKDFSFLRSFLMWGGIVALLLIVASFLFGFQMGTDTSNVMHHYEEDRYVAASLQLFSSIALMFYYVLMLFTSRR